MKTNVLSSLFYHELLSVVFIYYGKNFCLKTEENIHIFFGYKDIKTDPKPLHYKIPTSQLKKQVFYFGELY